MGLGFKQILTYSKIYYEANKEHIKQAGKDYKASHKCHIIEMHKKYYDTNKAIIAVKVKVIINCDCGRTYTKAHKTTHMKSLAHKTPSNIPVMAKFFESLTDENKPIRGIDLFNKFQAFLKDGNFKNEITSTRFGIDIKEYQGIEKTRTNKGVFYFIRFNILKEYITAKYKTE